MFLRVYKSREATALLLALSFAVGLVLNLIWPIGGFAADGSKSSWQTVRIASEGARPPYNYLDHNKLAGSKSILLAICAPV